MLTKPSSTKKKRKLSLQMLINLFSHCHCTVRTIYCFKQQCKARSHLVEKNLSGIKLYGNHTCVATHVSKGEQCSLQIVQNVPKKRVQVNHLYAIQADSSKPNPRMQAVEISNSTFIVELEGSIYPNRTQEECNSMKNHVSYLICIVTPWQYFIAHYGCRQITKVW